MRLLTIQASPAGYGCLERHETHGKHACSLSPAYPSFRAAATGSVKLQPAK